MKIKPATAVLRRRNFLMNCLTGLCARGSSSPAAKPLEADPFSVVAMAAPIRI